MVAETLNEQDEARLLDAVKTAVRLVDDDGLTPDEAVTKAARDGRLTPGEVRAISYAYNTGRQTHQWRVGHSVFDKLASFPLVNPEAAIAALYDTTDKAAGDAVSSEYCRPPRWLPAGTQKVAAHSRPPREAPPEYPRAGRMRQLDHAYGAVQREKNAVDELSRAGTCAKDRVRVKVAALVQYFKKHAATRMSFATVESAARTYFDGARVAPLFDFVYADAALKEKRGVDAAAPQVLSRALDTTPAGPLGMVKECLDAAAKAATTLASLTAGREKAAKIAEEVFRPFATAAGRGPPLDKVAVGGTFTSPAMLAGAMLGRSLGSVPKTKDDLIEDAWLDLEDPAHLNELRKIRAQVLLNSMMTDSDDPISGYDPDQVLRAYNEISQLAPRLAEQPAALRPVLRRRLEGHVEPFETKELTDIEKGLAATRMTTPNTALLSDAPDKLLG